MIGRFGNMDPTDGGSAHRYSLSGRWHETTAEAATRINAYVVKSDLLALQQLHLLPEQPGQRRPVPAEG